MSKVGTVTVCRRVPSFGGGEGFVGVNAEIMCGDSCRTRVCRRRRL